MPACVRLAWWHILLALSHITSWPYYSHIVHRLDCQPFKISLFFLFCRNCLKCQRQTADLVDDYVLMMKMSITIKKDDEQMREILNAEVYTKLHRE